MSFFERVLFAGGREWVCSQATGDVLEIAAGTGRNLRFYPEGVRLTATEFSPEMLAIARERLDTSSKNVELREADAQDLDFPDASFDTVVCTLALCTIPEPQLAVAEAYRVLRPGGRFLAFEHVGSPVRPVRAVQHLIEPLTVRFEGDHQTREPLEYLKPAGFQIEQLHRLKWGIVERVAARKPAS
jgi:ubiquinone/menaquinone biosynthesis C-methylase UbiE